MPSVDPALRIYCICGQKMKITPAMYGKPGRCVACRQRIRVPRPDEIPSGAKVIYLREHPEFLRKSPRHLSGKPAEAAESAPRTVSEPESEVPLGETDTGPWVPLDVFPLLHQLCCLDIKIKRRLAGLKGMEPAQSAADKATLLGYRSLLRKAREAVDEALRRALVETQEQLTLVEEQLNEAYVSLRVGDIFYEAYYAKVYPLRTRRERLLRRLHNLRGWLDTREPYVLGPYVDVSLEEIPIEPVHVQLPHDEMLDRPLVAYYIEHLRKQMSELPHVERRLAEAKQVLAQTLQPTEANQQLVHEIEGEHQRILARMEFIRKRLQQVVTDADNDEAAILAHLAVMRTQALAGSFSKTLFQDMEVQLRQTLTDLTQIKQSVLAALSAKTAEELPSLRRTLLERVAKAAPSEGIGVDSWLAWVTAAIAILTSIAPFSHAHVGSNFFAVPVLTTGLFIFAAVFAVVAALPRMQWRALGYSVVWSVGVAAGALYLNETYYALTPVGIALRSDPTWWTSVGVLMLGLTGVLGGMTALGASWPLRSTRKPAVTLAGVAVFSVFFFLSDGFGIFLPSFQWGPADVAVLPPNQGYQVTVPLTNRGLRTAWLRGNPQRVPFPYMVLVDKQAAPNVWSALSVDVEVISGEGSVMLHSAEAVAGVPMYPRSKVDLRFILSEPGVYRVRLASSRPTFPATEQIIEIKSLPGENASAHSEPRQTTTAATANAAAQAPIASTPTPQAVSSDNDENPGGGGGSAPDTGERASAPTVEPASGSASTLDTAENTADADSQGTADAAADVSVPRAGVQYVGVITSPGRLPRFIMNLHYPNGYVERRTVEIGAPLIGDWVIAEFNPTQRTVTVSNGEKLVILKTGEFLPID